MVVDALPARRDAYSGFEPKSNLEENAPCKNRTGVAKGLRDRNNPICTLSQHGYGGKCSVPFVLFNLSQKSSGLASQGLGSLQGASQDPESIRKIHLSAESAQHFLRRTDSFDIIPSGCLAEWYSSRSGCERSQVQFPEQPRFAQDAFLGGAIAVQQLVC